MGGGGEKTVFERSHLPGRKGRHAGVGSLREKMCLGSSRGPEGFPPNRKRLASVDHKIDKLKRWRGGSLVYELNACCKELGVKVAGNACHLGGGVVLVKNAKKRKIRSAFPGGGIARGRIFSDAAGTPFGCWQTHPRKKAQKTQKGMKMAIAEIDKLESCGD